MVSLLRHISIRVWVGLLLGGMASFLILPMLQSRVGLGYNIFVAAVLVLFFFWASGWLMTRLALNSANFLIAEAGALERDGMYREAESAFRKAVAIFDSFMVSPSVRRKKSGYLGSRLARFYLARSRRDQVSEDFITSYLQFNPQDEEVAEHWLHQIESGGGLREEHQELVERIGDAQPQNINIQAILARFYLLLERTDFPALQTYRRISRADGLSADGFVDNLAQLLVKEGRADEWALEIYLTALTSNFNRPEYLRGLAACLHWIPANERNRQLLQSARRYLNRYGAAGRDKMRQGFNPPTLIDQPRRVHQKFKAGERLNQALVTVHHGLQLLLRWISAGIESATGLIKHSRKIRRFLSAMLVFALITGIGALVINTVGHLSVKDGSGVKTVTPALPVITDPFTLQVAAYLKPQNAKNYVQQLKKLGVDAYWSEAVRGAKRWYQVRVSHFPTKQAARNYGEKLKAQGVIEDYYVANYRPQ